MQSLETKISRPRSFETETETRLQKKCLKTCLETEIKSRDSITANLNLNTYSHAKP